MKKKLLLTPIIIMSLASCRSYDDKIRDLDHRIQSLEITRRSNDVVLDSLTDKVFDGKCEKIHGKKFYPKAKVFENDKYKIYYRRKVKDTYIDTIIVFKEDCFFFSKDGILDSPSVTISGESFKSEGHSIYNYTNPEYKKSTNR